MSNEGVVVMLRACQNELRSVMVAAFSSVAILSFIFILYLYF